MRTLLAVVLSACLFGTAYAAEDPKDIQEPFVTLIVKICLKSNPLVCDEVVVTDSDSSALQDELLVDPNGPSSNARPQKAPVPLTMFGCMSGQSQVTLHLYMKKHHLEETHLPGGVRCQFGNRKITPDKRV